MKAAVCSVGAARFEPCHAGHLRSAILHRPPVCCSRGVPPPARRSSTPRADRRDFGRRQAPRAWGADEALGLVPALAPSEPQHEQQPHQGAGGQRERRLRLRQSTELGRVTPRTLVRLGLLLGRVFYGGKTQGPLRPLAAAAYGFKVLWTIVVTFSICGSGRAGFTFASMVPVEEESNGERRPLPPTDGAAPGDGLASTSGRHADAAGMLDVDDMVGAVTVHMIRLYGNMAQALPQHPPGATYALLANMAVDRGLRRRGIATAMMAAAEQMVLETFQPRPHKLLLLVYRDNAAAIKMYKALGWIECVGWVDPVWAEDAERGRMSQTRRLLFVKTLNEAPESMQLPVHVGGLSSMEQ
mmetsp:Transcript_24464/g.72526  ORF Transcript_24464/g.72526 Transcript_24464/m.72526 type:complete len:356 (-) Transcript_24464:234-1301(-)